MTAPVSVTPPRRSLLRRLALGLGFVLVTLAVAALLVLWLGFQSAPLPIQRPNVDKGPLTHDLAHGQWLQKTLRGEDNRLVLPVQPLNAVMADFFQQALKGGAGAVTPLGAQDVLLDISVPTSQTPLRKFLPLAWINIKTHWKIAPKGQFALHQVTWGQLPVPVFLVRWSFGMVARHYGVSTLVDVGLSTIRDIQVSKQRISVRWQWGPALRARTFATLIPANHIPSIQAYHMTLVKLMTEAGPVAETQEGFVPLLTILKPMFALAQQRTLARQMTSNAQQMPVAEVPVAENRALLLVMALHAMRVHPSELIPQASKWPKVPQYVFSLRNREDFAQHYLMSALLASGFGGRVVDLIGIYKEKADKIAGSGFSFNDLAADRAGIRFGQRAVSSAQQLQIRVQQGEDEDFFMPRVDDMPQFLTPEAFNQQFGAKNQAAYEGVLRQIDQRILKLGILQ